MVLAIVQNRLIIIGGVGLYRVKDSLVKMYDLDNNSWLEECEIPEAFTEVPPNCVSNNIVILCISKIYMFNPLTATWINVIHEFPNAELRNAKFMNVYRNILYIGNENENE